MSRNAKLVILLETRTNDPLGMQSLVFNALSSIDPELVDILNDELLDAEGLLEEQNAN